MGISLQQGVSPRWQEMRALEPLSLSDSLTSSCLSLLQTQLGFGLFLGLPDGRCYLSPLSPLEPPEEGSQTFLAVSSETPQPLPA
jgi:hypothetical protein